MCGGVGEGCRHKVCETPFVMPCVPELRISPSLPLLACPLMSEALLNPLHTHRFPPRSACQPAPLPLPPRLPAHLLLHAQRGALLLPPRGTWVKEVERAGQVEAARAERAAALPAAQVWESVGCVWARCGNFCICKERGGIGQVEAAGTEQAACGEGGEEDGEAGPQATPQPHRSLQIPSTTPP